MAQNQEQLASIIVKERAQKRERTRLTRAHRVTGERKRLIDVLVGLAIWTDDRKAHQFRLHYHFDHVLRELASRLAVPVKTLKYMFVGEISSVIEDGKTDLLGHGARRSRGGFVLRARNGIIRELLKKQAAVFIRVFSASSDQSELVGSVGSRGTRSVYHGIARILLSPKDGDKVRKGDFIVATMTSPDYVAIMQRAQGFITDEGGVTCHAAIVGREMNKPAIIGTKIGTQVLHDGDRIEVDTEKGTVKKIG